MLSVDSVNAFFRSLATEGAFFKYPSDTLTDWYHSVRKESANNIPAEWHGIFGGFYANTVGQSFIYGYELAIQRLFKQDTSQGLSAVCVTENKSTRPSDMATLLVPQEVGGFALSGKKDFVTLALKSDVLFVAAKLQTEQTVDDKSTIVMVRVPSARSGVNVRLLPLLPFVPDVSHGSVSFDSVSITHSDILTGDGYSDYVKPFRWFEDVAVFISISAYLFKIAIAYQWPKEAKAEMLALLSNMLDVQSMGAASGVAHMVLHDLTNRLEQWLIKNDAEWGRVPSELSDDWRRDRMILKIAQPARNARYARALDSLFGA